MKNKILVIAAAMMFFTACCNSEKRTETPVKQRNSIVILYENDVHCDIENYAKLAGLRDAISDTAYVGLVSSGDFLQGGAIGKIKCGAYIVDIMKNMHYDAVTLGNHEFDIGLPKLLELLSSFNAPIVCANLYDADSNYVYLPYTICEYGERKVGFVGVLTPETETISSSSFKEGLCTLNKDKMFQLVQQAVDETREKGCDYVVLLSHIGEKSNNGHKTSHDLVAATTGIDVVLDGHSHSKILCDTVMNAKGQPVYISQTGTWLENVGQLVITKDGNFFFKLIPSKDIPYVNKEVAKVTKMVDSIADVEFGPTVYHTDYTLAINDENGNRIIRNTETNAGDIVTDALRYMMDADMAFVNGGGIRKYIKKGDFKGRQIADMLSFDNTVVKIEATGATILEMLEKTTHGLPKESGDFPHVSNIRFTVHVVNGGNNYISSVKVRQPDGSYAPIDPNAKYTVATSDYCARKGFLNVFNNCPILKETNELYYIALVDYVSNVLGGNIPSQYAESQGRMTVVYE